MRRCACLFRSRGCPTIDAEPGSSSRSNRVSMPSLCMAVAIRSAPGVLPWRDDLWSGFIQSLPSSFLTRSASCAAVINLAILTSVLVDVACLNTTACENQSVVVSYPQF